MANDLNSSVEFQKLTDEFAADPSLEKYVEIRRRFPGVEMEVARFAGLDPLFALREELEHFEISPLMVCGVLDGDDQEIDELSLQIMEAMIDRREREEKGNTHLQSRREVISDGLIDYLIMTMLEAIEQHDLSIQTSLLVLIRERLGGANPARHQRYEKDKKRSDAIFLGVHFAEKGQEPSIRRVADVLGVHPSTVSRWFPDGDFRQKVESMRGLEREIARLVSKNKAARLK